MIGDDHLAIVSIDDHPMIHIRRAGRFTMKSHQIAFNVAKAASAAGPRSFQ